MSFSNIIIPARAGSKGWPGKNIRLFDHTASIIPPEYRSSVIVSTDDPTITGLAESYNFEVRDRPENLASDRSDTKSVVRDLVKEYKIKPSSTVIMLYLTYPNRTWDDVTGMYNTFTSSQARSMLCQQPVKTHPCLMMFPGPNSTGIQVVKHDLYQRQQYPECFELSHYICMFKPNELKKLNKNMYNEDTQYYSIERTIDVDCESDYNMYIESKNDSTDTNHINTKNEYQNSC